jgi:hypothetical protein
MYKQAVETLADGTMTTLVLVTRPETAPFKEAERASGELSALHIQWLALLLIDMFPRTTVFQKWPKNPLTCFHVQMVSKMANRHQFYQLGPR